MKIMARRAKRDYAERINIYQQTSLPAIVVPDIKRFIMELQKPLAYLPRVALLF